MKKVMNVEGMSCSHCINTIKGAFVDVEGISKVEVLIEKKQVIVTGSNLDEEMLKMKIEEEGYQVQSIEEGE